MLLAVCAESSVPCAEERFFLFLFYENNEINMEMSFLLKTEYEFSKGSGGHSEGSVFPCAGRKTLFAIL